MLLVDGVGSISNQSQSMHAYGSNRGAVYKQTSKLYSLKVTGKGIETCEQQNLEIAGNTVHGVTVIGTVADIDGNVYRTVKIGNQWWMAENLKVTHYRNDNEIPNLKGDTDWSNLTTGTYADYDDDANIAHVYGRLYNGYAVNDIRNVAPAGWHMPSDEEWKKLEMVLGMSQSAADSNGYRGRDEGGKLKEAGTSHWFDPNTGANNETGFSALPGGYRRNTVGYHDIGYYTYFWSSAKNGIDQAWYRLLSYKYSKAYRLSLSMRIGFSVRCVRN